MAARSARSAICGARSETTGGPPALNRRIRRRSGGWFFSFFRLAAGLRNTMPTPAGVRRRVHGREIDRLSGICRRNAEVRRRAKARCRWSRRPSDAAADRACNSDSVVVPPLCLIDDGDTERTVQFRAAGIMDRTPVLRPELPRLVTPCCTSSSRRRRAGGRQIFTCPLAYPTQP